MIQGNRFAVAVCAATIVLSATVAQAAVVSFLVDPSTIDGGDGVVGPGEFNPVGDDGTVFTMTPTDNLVGGPRFLLDDTNGLRFGGGGGSSIEFDFSTNKDIKLESYVIPDTFLLLNNPTFDVLEGITSLSAGNAGGTDGTIAFASGPIMITAGTTYTVDINATGAAVQSFFSAWNYTMVAIPTPAALPAALLGLGALAARRRRRC